MAKFKCPHCGTERVKDLRKRQYKGKTKLKAYCGKAERSVFMMKQK